MRGFLIATMLFISGMCYSQKWYPATVKAVHDGDTYRVEVIDTSFHFKTKRYFKDSSFWIRGWGFNSLECASHLVCCDQPYGRETRDITAALIGQRQIWICPTGKYSYGHLVCKIKFTKSRIVTDRVEPDTMVPGDSIYYIRTAYDTLNMANYQIVNGMAWATSSYYNDDEKKFYAELQWLAKMNKLGFWGLPGRKYRPETWRKIKKRTNGSTSTTEIEF